MQKRSASSAAVSRNRIHVAIFAIAAAAVVIFGIVLLIPRGPSYALDPQGFVRLSCPQPDVRERILRSDGNATVSSIVYYSGDQDVYALLVASRDPRAALIIVPGGGVRKEAHAERAAAYARGGIVTLIVDTRGNSGETAGPAPRVEEDCRLFRDNRWPVFYRQECDIIGAALYLRQRFGTDVYVMGESNGGRYAIMAAAADPRISGLVAVSTSGFDRYGSTIAGDPAVFIESIDPDRLIARISPRPVWVFHAPEDTFIPIADGIRLYGNAKEPKEFVNFSGTHGINEHVDEWVVATLGRK